MNFRPHRLPRRTLCALLLFAALPASAERLQRDGYVYDAVGPADAALIEQLLTADQARGMRMLDWQADGTLLVALRSEATEQLHRVRTPLATPELIAPGPDRVLAAAAQPFQNDSLAILRQASGRDASLWLLRTDGSEPRELMGAEWRAERPLWAHDGQRLAVTTATRGLLHEVYLLDTRTRETPRALLSDGGDWQALDWSLDDRALLLRHRDALGAGELVWLDIASGERRTVAMAPAGEALAEARIGPDGRSVLYLGREGGDWQQLWSASLDGRSRRALTPALRRHVEHYAISANGRYLAYSYDDNGWSRLVVADQQLAAERSIPSLPAGVIDALQFDRSGAHLAINSESSAAPPDVYVLDIASNALVRWTQASAGPGGRAELSAAQPVRYRGWNAAGGTAAGALLYLPGVSPTLTTRGGAAPLPVIVYLEDASGAPRPRFDPLVQALANIGGFAVLVPELSSPMRGGDHADEVRDIGAALLWIGRQTGLDAAHVAIVGQGARSAVALGALALFSDRLQRGVIVDGDASGVPLLAIERPVLITRGFTTPLLNSVAADQMLWRLRAARSGAGLFGRAGDAPPFDSGERRAQLAGMLLRFLQDGRSATASLPASPGPATRPGG